jgi:hypothetical protein
MLAKPFQLLIAAFIGVLPCCGQASNSTAASAPANPAPVVKHTAASGVQGKPLQRQAKSGPPGLKSPPPNLNPAVVWPGVEVTSRKKAPKDITCSIENYSHPEISPNMHQGDQFYFNLTGQANGVITVTQTYNGVSTDYLTPWTIPSDGVFRYLATQGSLTGAYSQEWFVDGVACINNPIQFEILPVVPPEPTSTKDYIYFNGKVVAIENYN